MCRPRKTAVLLLKITALASAFAAPDRFWQNVLHEATSGPGQFPEFANDDSVETIRSLFTSSIASFASISTATESSTPTAGATSTISISIAATTGAVLDSLPTQSLPASTSSQAPALRVQSKPIRFLKHVFQMVESKANFHHCTNVSRSIEDDARKSSESPVPISLASSSYTPPVPHSTTIDYPSLISSDRLLEAPTPTAQPTHHPAPRHDQVLFAFIITSFIFILVCVPLFLCSRALTPRRRADWAARKEECCNQHLYRQAAHQQKLRNWINRLTGNRLLQTPKEPLHTWNEKRLANQQEPLQLDMRDEILARRRMYDMVNSVTRAEEGRVGEMDEKSVISGWLQNRASRSSSNVTGPPPYEEDDGIVVDGFQYILQQINNTPGSSVIETSPRPSLYTRDSDSEKD